MKRATLLSLLCALWLSTLPAALGQQKPLDVIVLIDSSPSTRQTDPGDRRLQAVKFLHSYLAASSESSGVNHYLGWANFGGEVRSSQPLTLIAPDGKFQAPPRQIIDYTDFRRPLDFALKEMNGRGRDSSTKVVVLFTDGRPDLSGDVMSRSEMEGYFRNREDGIARYVERAKQDGVELFVIGLGSEAPVANQWRSLLTAGHYSEIASTEELMQSYQKLFGRFLGYVPLLEKPIAEGASAVVSVEPYLDSISLVILKSNPAASVTIEQSDGLPELVRKGGVPGTDLYEVYTTLSELRTGTYTVAVQGGRSLALISKRPIRIVPKPLPRSLPLGSQPEVAVTVSRLGMPATIPGLRVGAQVVGDRIAGESFELNALPGQPGIYSRRLPPLPEAQSVSAIRFAISYGGTPLSEPSVPDLQLRFESMPELMDLEVASDQASAIVVTARCRVQALGDLQHATVAVVAGAEQGGKIVATRPASEVIEFAAGGTGCRFQPMRISRSQFGQAGVTLVLSGVLPSGTGFRTVLSSVSLANDSGPSNYLWNLRQLFASRWGRSLALSTLLLVLILIVVTRRSLSVMLLRWLALQRFVERVRPYAPLWLLSLLGSSEEETSSEQDKSLSLRESVLVKDVNQGPRLDHLKRLFLELPSRSDFKAQTRKLADLAKHGYEMKEHVSLIRCALARKEGDGEYLALDIFNGEAVDDGEGRKLRLSWPNVGEEDRKLWRRWRDFRARSEQLWREYRLTFRDHSSLSSIAISSKHIKEARCLVDGCEKCFQFIEAQESTVEGHGSSCIFALCRILRRLLADTPESVETVWTCIESEWSPLAKEAASIPRGYLAEEITSLVVGLDKLRRGGQGVSGVIAEQIPEVAKETLSSWANEFGPLKTLYLVAVSHLAKRLEESRLTSVNLADAQTVACGLDWPVPILPMAVGIGRDVMVEVLHSEAKDAYLKATLESDGAASLLDNGPQAPMIVTPESAIFRFRLQGINPALSGDLKLDLKQVDSRGNELAVLESVSLKVVEDSKPEYCQINTVDGWLLTFLEGLMKEKVARQQEIHVLEDHALGTVRLDFSEVESTVSSRQWSVAVKQLGNIYSGNGKRRLSPDSWLGEVSALSLVRSFIPGIIFGEGALEELLSFLRPAMTDAVATALKKLRSDLNVNGSRYASVFTVKAVRESVGEALIAGYPDLRVELDQYFSEPEEVEGAKAALTALKEALKATRKPGSREDGSGAIFADVGAIRRHFVRSLQSMEAFLRVLDQLAALNLCMAHPSGLQFGLTDFQGMRIEKHLLPAHQAA